MQPKYSKGDGVSFRFGRTERNGMITGSFVRHGRVVYDITGSPRNEKYVEIPESAILSITEIEPIRNPNGSKISKIEIKPAIQVFGESARNPDRPVAVMWTENGARLTLSVPLGARYRNGNWEVFDSNALERSIGYERSRFGAFVRRYRRWPNVGLEVNTSMNGRGYMIVET